MDASVQTTMTNLPQHAKQCPTQQKWEEVKHMFETVKKEVVANPDLFKLNRDINSWQISWNKRKGALGLCRYGPKLIEISAYMIWGGAKKEVLNNTIRHEFAHALTPGHHHDEVWRSVALKLGCDGLRCSADETLSVTAPRRYEIKCKTHGDSHFCMKRHNRPGIQKMNKWCCPKCKGKLQIYMR